MNLICIKSFLLTLHMALGQDVTLVKAIDATSNMEKIYTCPRCRRATPPGPRKRPSESPKKDKKKQ